MPQRNIRDKMGKYFPFSGYTHKNNPAFPRNNKQTHAINLANYFFTDETCTFSKSIATGCCQKASQN